MITDHIFLEILKAVCLEMEQKLVQRCETEIVANDCDASYFMDVSYILFIHLTDPV